MIASLLKKTVSLLLNAVLIVLLLLAVYVSLGRQLLPYLDTYRDAIVQELSVRLGQPVRVASLEGQWRQFNPLLRLQQVEVGAAGPEDAGSPLVISSLELELDAWASLLTRKLQLKAVTLDSPALTLVEDATGRWQLRGVEAQTDLRMTPDQLLELVSQVGDLSLSNLDFTLQRADGRSRRFERSRLRVQNRGDAHFVHWDIWQDGVIGPLTLAAELTGHQIAALTGSVYVLVPDSDYSDIVSMPLGTSYALDTLTGHGELWLQVDQGAVASVQGNINLGALGLRLPGEVTLSDLATGFFVRRMPEAGWEGWLQNLHFAWGEQRWRESNAYGTFVPAHGLSLGIDVFNVGIASNLVVASEQLPETGRTILQEHNLRGELADLNLEWQVSPQGESATGTDAVRLEANLNDVAVSARGAAPSLWGVDGYLSLEVDTAAQRVSGVAEVDSDRLMFQLPRMFTDIWRYDHLNGRVSMALDLSRGQELTLSSSVIVAESPEATGRVQFSLYNRRTTDEDNASDLELMVGITEADATSKALYLPRAPQVRDGLRNLMNWLNDGVQGGIVRDSGLVFRGSVLPGAQPAEKTLQMVFNVDDGTLRYDPQWPELERLTGNVVINDRNVDISISTGESRGIRFDATTAAIRPNEQGVGNWLSVTGRGTGQTQQGLDYLRETPVTRGFGNYIAPWQGEGEVDLTLNLRIPLGIPGATPEVDVALALQDDTLIIPEFSLQFTDLAGALRYNTASGLSGDALTATLFEQPVTASVSSRVDASRNTHTRVELAGTAGIGQLQAWPRQSAFVVDLLSRARGDMDYLALLEIDQLAETGGQPAASAPQSRLTITSDLNGVSLAYPAPFFKDVGTSMPLQLRLDFLGGREELRLSLADIASMNLGLSGGQIRNGLIFLGQQSEGVSVRRLNANAPGVDVVGSLAHFDFGEWMTALRGPVNAQGSTQAQRGNFASLRTVINAVDVTIADAAAFGQRATDLNVQISSEDRDWKLALSSETVAGEVRVPYAAALPLTVSLSHLRFPAPPEEADGPPFSRSGLVGPPDPQDPIWVAPVDILAGVDPRTFPSMQFAAASVSRGDVDYGAWQFHLTPTSGGAEFTQLLFDTRGIRAGREGEEGRFVWTFDGEQHHSYFSSLLEADNIGAVLSSFGYAPSLESASARFEASLDWPGSPAFFQVESLSGDMELQVRDGRFLQSNASAANGALKLISIINFDALVRRLRFSDDLLRSGLSYEQITGSLRLNDGIVDIVDRLQIIGPASLFQVTGKLDLANQTIDGFLYITLPVSDNIPWMSGIAMLNNLINWQVAVGMFLFDQIFGEQVDSLTSAQYLLQGPWEGLEPRLNQVFGTPDASGNAAGARVAPATGTPADSPSPPLPTH